MIWYDIREVRRFYLFVCMYISVAHLAVYFYFIVRIRGFTDCKYEVPDNCDAPQGQETIANWPAAEQMQLPIHVLGKDQKQRAVHNVHIGCPSPSVEF